MFCCQACVRDKRRDQRCDLLGYYTLGAKRNINKFKVQGVDYRDLDLTS